MQGMYLVASMYLHESCMRVAVKVLHSCAFIGFAIWPDLTRTQSLNYAIIKAGRPTVAIGKMCHEWLQLFTPGMCTYQEHGV